MLIDQSNIIGLTMLTSTLIVIEPDENIHLDLLYPWVGGNSNLSPFGQSCNALKLGSRYSTLKVKEKV